MAESIDNNGKIFDGAATFRDASPNFSSFGFSDLTIRYGGKKHAAQYVAGIIIIRRSPFASA
jgi:hypothetical protein